MSDLQRPLPVLTAHLFPETLSALLELLSSLEGEDWNRPTVCSGWSVKDVAAHLLGGDVGILSRKRDSFTPGDAKISGWADLVALINGLNAEWVAAMRRISPDFLVTLLEFTGNQVNDYFSSLDPSAIGDPVDWVAEGPAPVWLDLAREYTERWHHQQQIRDATGRPGHCEDRYLGAVLETFVRALPRTYADADAPLATSVLLTIDSRSWSLVREESGWQLYSGTSNDPSAVVRLDGGAAWRLFTKGLKPDSVGNRVSIAGDRVLGERLLSTISIIG
jgi:uncharacterized protein (TIGR03083 family)